VARPIRGLNPATGALAVGDFVRPGQCVRFLCFDKEGAEADLDAAVTEQARRELARSLLRGGGGGPSVGALMFSCAGRGRALFGAPHRDAAALSALLPLPLATATPTARLGRWVDAPSCTCSPSCSRCCARAAGRAAATLLRTLCSCDASLVELWAFS
jgi:hypothetical protein